MEDNKLKEEIAEVLGERELWDFENTLNVEVRTDKLYSLIEDVVLQFNVWKELYGWEMGYRQQQSFTTKEMFHHFIKNIYQK